MRDYVGFIDLEQFANPKEFHQQFSRKLLKDQVVDALAYSLEFERALLSKINLFQKTLDFVSGQLQSSVQRRLMTKLEHNALAMASLAYERALNFGLTKEKRLLVPIAHLNSAIHSAIQMITSPANASTSLDAIIKKIGGTASESDSNKQFLCWDNPQNLSDLLDLKSSGDIKLLPGNNARKLHYICQLSIFTSTPKRPDDYPLSVYVEPQEFFSLSTMWARKPSLWTKNAFVTHSGKLIVSKNSLESEMDFRKNLGLLSDLHLTLAKLIKQNFNFQPQNQICT